jgi:hypothetical protein
MLMLQLRRMLQYAPVCRSDAPQDRDPLDGRRQAANALLTTNFAFPSGNPELITTSESLVARKLKICSVPQGLFYIL